jgi:hypothetical protein
MHDIIGPTTLLRLVPIVLVLAILVLWVVRPPPPPK